MTDLIREAPLGQLIRWLTAKKYFKYPEEEEGFRIPWEGELSGETTRAESNLPEDLSKEETVSREPTNEDAESTIEARITRTKTRESTMPWSGDRFDVEMQQAVEREKSRTIVPTKTSDGIILVDWYTTDDPANPQNWSTGKKIYVCALIL